jgi:hypothetical protein
VLQDACEIELDKLAFADWQAGVVLDFGPVESRPEVERERALMRAEWINKTLRRYETITATLQTRIRLQKQARESDPAYLARIEQEKIALKAARNRLLAQANPTSAALRHRAINKKYRENISQEALDRKRERNAAYMRRKRAA